MSNPFGYLRRSSQQRFGTLAMTDAREVEEIDVINHDGLYVTLLVGKARGVWCGGYRYNLGSSQGYCPPSLMWGWYEERRYAILHLLGELVGNTYGVTRKQLLMVMWKYRQRTFWGEGKGTIY